ncbi:MAG: hypothetical protein VSS52_009115 [Thiotrichaceae bacterium]|nr:hypothetical protein [Thiotrichaceae bacterium]
MLGNTINTNSFEQVLHATERLPIDEQLLLIECIIENIRHKQKTTSFSNIEAACGILQAKHTVSLEQMDMAIKQQGSQA